MSNIQNHSFSLNDVSVEVSVNKINKLDIKNQYHETVKFAMFFYLLFFFFFLSFSSSLLCYCLHLWLLRFILSLFFF